MRCQECNYDLTGTGSDFCPECGASAYPAKLLTPDAAFETIARVIGTWMAATAIIGILTIVIDAYLGGRRTSGSLNTTAGMVPGLVVGVYLLFFAPQIRRLCYRNAAPRGYTSRAIFHLVVGLVGVWLVGRALGDIGRNVTLELLSPRPQVSFARIAAQLPRVAVGLFLVVAAGWLSRVWRGGGG